MAKVSFNTEHLLKQFQLTSEKFETVLKKFFDPLGKIYPLTLHYFSSFFKQTRLKEYGTDTLFNKPYDVDLLKELKLRGYKQTTKSFYPLAFANAAIISTNTVNSATKNVSSSFDYKDTVYDIFFKNQLLFFYSEQQEFLSMKIPEGNKFIDVHYCENGFLDIIIEDSVGSKTLYKTHLSLGFLEFEYDQLLTTQLKDIENLFVADIDIDYDKVIESTLDYMIVSKNNRKHKIEFIKKYFFVENNVIYFNSFSKETFAEFKTRGFELIRTEHIFLYDFINFMGLNNLKDYYGVNFNSYFFDNLKKKAFNFDNTLNGALNFINLNTEKDFFFNKRFEQVHVFGNFTYNNEPGKYKIKTSIEMYDEEVKAIFYLEQNGRIVKRVVNYSTDRKCYFCNLSFDFYNIIYENEFFEMEFEIKDNYNVSFEKAFEKDDYASTTAFSFMEESTEFAVNNKVETNFSKEGKKEVIYVVSTDSNLFIKSYIDSDSSRSSVLDKQISLVDKENRPSAFWQNIEDKNYYLQDNQEIVKKRIYLKQNDDMLFRSEETSFRLDLTKSDI